jgi:hypothetical protein
MVQHARDLAERLYYFPRELRRRRYDAKVTGARAAADNALPAADRTSS